MSSKNLGAQPPSDLPHGIEGLESYPFQWWPWLLLLFGICLIGLLAFFFYRRLKFRTKIIPSKDLVLEVFKRIRSLQVQEPFHKKQQELFFYELSFGLRQFLELKLALPATDKTFQELKRSLSKQRKVPAELMQKILVFLKKSESIKFAHKQVTSEEALFIQQEVLSWMEDCSKVLEIREEEKKHR